MPKPTRRRHAPSIDEEDDTQPLIVPRNERALVPPDPARIRQLRRNLVSELKDLRAGLVAKHPAIQAPPDPEGFTARVAIAACTLCQGWCCKVGGDHAFLDDRSLARICRDHPALGVRALLRLILDRLPRESYQGSCVFHGPQGCTLDRTLRSDICNQYYCGGLGSFVTRGDPTRPVKIFAGEGRAMRTAPRLKP